MKTRFNGVWLSIATIGFMIGAALIIAGSLSVNGVVSYNVNVTVDGPFGSNHVLRTDPDFSLTYPGSSFLVHIDPEVGIPTWIDPDTDEVGDGYLGWCVEPGPPIPPATLTPAGYDGVMYSTLDLPAFLEDYADWNEINYILNHKLAQYDVNVYPWATTPYLHDSEEVQDAIYHFIDGHSYGGTDGHIWALIGAASNNPSYEPDPTAGDIVAYVIHFDDDPEGERGPAFNYQDLLIEIKFPPSELGDETAWAFGEYTWIDEGIGKNWGWFFEYDTTGTHTSEGSADSHTLWAGAGQNDLNKGTDVGDALVWDNGGYLYIKYNLDPGFYLTEAHIYVGAQKPTTNAPGQFPYGDDSLAMAQTYTEVIDLTDFGTATDLYIAVHGVVYG